MLKRLTNFIRTTLHPENYHGRFVSQPFFEGWYFKVVDSSGKHRYSFIPGVFLGKSNENSHAFVQVLDGASSSVEYHRYPIEQFWSADDHFEIRIGDNSFSLKQIELNINNHQQIVQGNLKFDNPIGWPVHWTSPGVMGWYAWVPNMECYHGVLGFDHAVSGKIQVNQHEVDFSGGRGYIEKDWGKAFPQSWIWMQSNHFVHTRASLTASVAIIPWMGSAFAGFIVGFWQNGKLHRFATYANSRINNLSVNDKYVVWTMQNRTHILEIQARQAQGGLLLAPTPQGMGRRIPETLSANIHVRLINRKINNVEFEGTGDYAGLEVVGKMDKLINMAIK
ncbi:MAG: hypothetical protein CL609_06080 [Anaerolineaceae bacterium]|nr:hypothetical protein [Anaerolineaceae bacterium]